MYKYLILSLAIGLICIVSQTESVQRFVRSGSFECEGTNAGDYSYVGGFSEQDSCGVPRFDVSIYLIVNLPNGQKSVNPLDILTQSQLPDGAYVNLEVLFLSLSGNLAGKNIYLKEKGLVTAFLKKCSSILGYSYITTKSQTLLIADKLDVNCFLRPTGCFELFQLSANTICKGITYTF